MKKAVYIGGALLLLGLILFGLRPQPTEVDLGTVANGQMRVTVDEEGKTRIRDRYKVMAPLSGQMRRVELKPGDEVTQGQTQITAIEPTDPALLDARAVASARARVAAAKASKQQTAQMLEKSRVSLDFAESEFRRTRTTYENRGSSEQALREAETLLRTRQLDLKAAQFAEQIANFELEQAEAALLQVQPQSAANEPPRLVVPAPITGVVLGVVRESAGVVTAGAPLIELGDPKNLEVVVQVLSRDAVAINPGAEVILEQWGGEKPLRGRIRRVEPSGFTKISALGVEEQRVNVLLDFTDPHEARKTLGDGFRVEARIVVWERDNVLKVPAGALFRHNGEHAVYVATKNVSKLQTVQIGRSNALEAEVLAGLNDGDRVVMHPSDKVKDGGRVVERQ